jgi:hypothetical protein
MLLLIWKWVVKLALWINFIPIRTNAAVNLQKNRKFKIWNCMLLSSQHQWMNGCCKNIFFTQALGLESFITMIGHRFPKFYDASLHATYWKCNFWKQKFRMPCEVLCIHIYSTLKMGLFTLTFHCNIIGYRSRRFLCFIQWEYLFGIEFHKISLKRIDVPALCQIKK